MTTTRTDAGPAVVFREVVKVYNGRITALDHVSFEIARGATVALLGPNGAGKSTAIDAMLGLRTPTSGQVRVLGMTPSDAVAAGKIGGMVQTGGLPEGSKVRELLGLFRQLYRDRRSGQVLADGTPAQIKAYTSIRTIRFSSPEPDTSVLLRLPGVSDVSLSGDTATIRTADADATLPALYGLGRLVRGLEVGGGGLEEALLALTSDDRALAGRSSSAGDPATGPATGTTEPTSVMTKAG